MHTFVVGCFADGAVKVMMVSFGSGLHVSGEGTGSDVFSYHKPGNSSRTKGETQRGTKTITGSRPSLISVVILSGFILCGFVSGL